ELLHRADQEAEARGPEEVREHQRDEVDRQRPPRERVEGGARGDEREPALTDDPHEEERERDGQQEARQDRAEESERRPGHVWSARNTTDASAGYSAASSPSSARGPSTRSARAPLAPTRRSRARSPASTSGRCSGLCASLAATR